MLEDLNRISKEMDKVFKAPLWETTSNFYPSYETNENELELALPGFTKEDINIEVDGSIMTISATVENESKYRKNFKRYFTIGEDVDLDKIKATMEHGILYVKWNKKQAAKKATKVNIK